MGTSSATSIKDPVLNWYWKRWWCFFSVVDTKKRLLSMIPFITSGCRWTTWYHIINFLIAQTNKYMTNWRKNILHLPKDIINWSMNSITTKVVIRF
jgi:hypothetical protein